MAGLWMGIMRFRWAPLLTGLAAFAAVCLLWQWQDQSDNRNRTITQLDLVMITDSLKSFSADSAVAISPDSINNLNASNLYKLLSATNAGAIFLGHQKDWDQRRELVDAWQRPFQIQLVHDCSPTQYTNQSVQPATVGVKIWSVGSNGKDESGTGDDITGEVVAVRLHQ